MAEIDTSPVAALVRHGDYHQRAGAPSALQPFPLNQRGEAQARAAVPRLDALMRDHGLTLAPIVHCSPQLRAWSTADIIAQGLRDLGHEVSGLVETPALSERSVGTLANLTAEEIEAVVKSDPRHAPPPEGWKSDSHYALPYPGAESLIAAGQRVAAHLKATLEGTAPSQLQLFVGHGASFRHAAHHLGVLSFEEIRQLSMFHAHPLLLRYNPHGSWRHFAGDWKIRAPKEVPLD